MIEFKISFFEVEKHDNIKEYTNVEVALGSLVTKDQLELMKKGFKYKAGIFFNHWYLIALTKNEKIIEIPILVEKSDYFTDEEEIKDVRFNFIYLPNLESYPKSEDETLNCIDNNVTLFNFKVGKKYTLKVELVETENKDESDVQLPFTIIFTQRLNGFIEGNVWGVEVYSTESPYANYTYEINKEYLDINDKTNKKIKDQATKTITIKGKCTKNTKIYFRNKYNQEDIIGPAIVTEKGKTEDGQIIRLSTEGIRKEGYGN